LLSQLEEAVKTGTPERRVDMLRRVTDLFLGDSQRLTEAQVAVFDDVLIQLTQRIEIKALVQLSSCLAPVDNAPIEVVRRLSRHDEIAVAGPVISQSNRLSEQDLVEIARSKSQGHLLAMSGRSSLQKSVTDVLIERGNADVHRTLALNAGAEFSEFGYASLLRKSDDDEVLTESLGLRLDIPVQLLTQLLARATDRVRARLLAATRPENQEKVQQALASITRDVVRHAAGPRDFTAAESLVDALNRQGKLNEAVLADFVKQGKYEEMTATLALFCSVKSEIVERILKNVNHGSVVVVCKAARLTWPTTRLVLENRFAHHMLSQQELDGAKDAFLELSQEVAQRSMRFMQVQQAAKKTG
jgi:uncharacterized protein (DUF2336 family)